MMKDKGTGDLLRALGAARREDQLRSLLDCVPARDQGLSFGDYYRSRPGVRGRTSAELIRRSGLDRSYYYQILRGSRKPGRSKVLAMALAGRLTVEETQRALRLAGCAGLYARVRRDLILLFCLERGYDAVRADILLADYGEMPLSGPDRAEI